MRCNNPQCIIQFFQQREEDCKMWFIKMFPPRSWLLRFCLALLFCTLWRLSRLFRRPFPQKGPFSVRVPAHIVVAESHGIAAKQLICLRDELRKIQPGKMLSLGVAVLGLNSTARRGAIMSHMALPALTQQKVIVGGGAHGVKYVGFIGDLELWGKKRNNWMQFTFC